MAKCQLCRQSGKCHKCNGRGLIGGIIPTNCPTCKGKRVCFNCNGKGWRN